MEIPASFTKVALSSTGGAGTVEILAKAAGKVPRIHALSLTPDSTGTSADSFLIESSTGGGTPTALIGKVLLGAGRIFGFPFVPTKEGALTGTSGRNLQIVSTGQGFDGFAIVSASSN